MLLLIIVIVNTKTTCGVKNEVNIDLKPCLLPFPRLASVPAAWLRVFHRQRLEHVRDGNGSKCVACTELRAALDLCAPASVHTRHRTKFFLYNVGTMRLVPLCVSSFSLFCM